MKTGFAVALLLTLHLTGWTMPRCHGQDLELFELDDVIYPSELIVPLRGESPRPRRFLALQLLAGFDAHYQFRSQFPETDVYFLRTAASYHTSRLQLSVKATGFRAARGLASPQVKVRSQVGYYTTSRVDGVRRLRLTWDVQKSPGSGVTHNLGVDWDFAYRLGAREWIGGVAFAWAPTDGALYLGGAYRVQIVSFRRGWSLNFGYGVGIRDVASIKLDGSTVLDFAKAEFSLRIPFPRLDGTIHVAYAPAYQFRVPRWNQEVGVFLEVPVAAHLF